MSNNSPNKKVIAIIGILVVILAIYRDNIINVITKLNNSLMPFLYGLMLAYLVSPLYNIIKNQWLKKSKAKNILSILIIILMYILIIFLVINIFVPQIVESIKGIINSLPTVVNELQDLINDNIDNKYIKLIFGDEVFNLTKFINDSNIQNKISENTSEIINVITSKLSDIGKYIINSLLSLIISVFILAYKDELKRGTQRLVKIITKDKYDIVYNECIVANKIFSGFVVGKLIDSLIIMIITLLFMLIANMPYIILISTIIFITNMIPIVGPVIGAVPSLIIILAVNPVKALIFLIFIIILQQLDGHIIGPKCIGSATGINSFWVLFSILIGGGTFGILGLLLAVPVCAVVIDIVNKYVNILESNKDDD